MIETMTSQNIDLSSWGTLYIPSFMKIYFRHSKVEKGDTQTHRQHGDCISLYSFFQNKERTPYANPKCCGEKLCSCITCRQIFCICVCQINMFKAKRILTFRHGAFISNFQLLQAIIVIYLWNEWELVHLQWFSCHTCSMDWDTEELNPDLYVFISTHYMYVHSWAI
jgi:hypothetical protein